MSMLPIFKSDKYTDGRTKQAFADSTDINKLLARAAKGDSITHLAKHGAQYGDFSDIDDLLTGMNRLKKGEAIFADLPGEVRREFGQSPQAFFNYVNNPDNIEKLDELIPGLAAPGNQLKILRTATVDPGIEPPADTPPPDAADSPPAAPPGGTPPASPE